MPGTILSLKIAVGQAVKKGDVLLILEAMKMENEIIASRDASVGQVLVAQGASVDTGTPLLTLV
jgi:biotin carboxyl carrier protein